MSESEVVEKCVTRQGIALTVRAVIAFKVGNDHESIVNAGQRFLSDQEQMSVLTGRIFAGHLRSIIGSMTVEEIVTERQKLATEVLDTSKAEMAKIGLHVDSLQIQSIDDGNTGYIEAMSRPHKAAIQRQAQIAPGAGHPGGDGGRAGGGGAQQAEYARGRPRWCRPSTTLLRDRPGQGAGRAGRRSLAQAHAQQEVLAAQTELALRQAELRRSSRWRRS